MGGKYNVEVDTSGKLKTTEIGGQIWACGDTLTDYRDGQKYKTVQIGDQCWMSENLNIGTYVESTYDPNYKSDLTDNGSLEKYCYDNNIQNCIQYGGLYGWEELINYTKGNGFGGICPYGWKIPTDNDWKILEGFVDSQYSVGDLEWERKNLRGFDVGDRLRSTSGWTNGNGNDLYGFTVIPGGHRKGNGTFAGIGDHAYFWTSTYRNDEISWYRALVGIYHESGRLDDMIHLGFSVRCIKE
jgi:uncharacterized protein (TIGR02145 family)